MSEARKYRTPQEEALDVAMRVRDRIVNGERDSVSLLRQCLIVSQNLGKIEDTRWIFREINGYPEKDEDEKKDNARDLSAREI